jgi:hypothetical protein
MFALSKAVLASDLLGGEMAGLHHQPSGLYAQWFITLAGGSFGFVSKKSTELSWTYKGNLRQVSSLQQNLSFSWMRIS